MSSLKLMVLDHFSIGGSLNAHLTTAITVFNLTYLSFSALNSLNHSWSDGADTLIRPFLFMITNEWFRWVKEEAWIIEGWILLHIWSAAQLAEKRTKTNKLHDSKKYESSTQDNSPFTTHRNMPTWWSSSVLPSTGLVALTFFCSLTGHPSIQKSSV